MSSILQSYFNFIRKCIPRKPEGTSVGLDIGPAECRVVELRKKDDGFELVNLHVAPISESAAETTLQGVFKKLQGPHDGVYTAVSGRGTLIRFISLPRMSIEDLRSSFAFEADKYFPFPQDQIYTDCYILDPSDKGKEMSVMAAAVKKELIDQRMGFLGKINAKPEFVGLTSVALANAVNVLQKDADKNGVKAYLNIEENVTSLTICIENVPRFTRDIFIGGQDISKRISHMLGITVQEADALRIQPLDKAEQIKSAYESLVMNILQEIRLSFDYFSTENNAEVSTLYLTGVGAVFTGMQDMFKQNLDIPIEIWNTFEKVSLSSNVSQQDFKNHAHKLAIALGLAFYNYD